MIKKDINFCDQILQIVAALDKKLRISIFIFFFFSILIFLFSKTFSTLIIFLSAVTFEQHQLYYFFSNI